MKFVAALVKQAKGARILAANRAERGVRREIRAFAAIGAIIILLDCGISPCHAHDAVKDIKQKIVVRATYLNEQGVPLFDETLNGNAVNRKLSKAEQAQISSGEVKEVVYRHELGEFVFVETPNTQRPKKRALTPHLDCTDSAPCQPPNCITKTILGFPTCTCKH